MSPTELDARLRAAWEAVQVARMARQRGTRLPAARRAIERAKGLLLVFAHDLAVEADRLAALIASEAQLVDRTAGDRWALIREVDALRAEGAAAHAIARAAIRVGACAGPATAAAVQACETRLRKDRARFRTRRP